MPEFDSPTQSPNQKQIKHEGAKNNVIKSLGGCLLCIAAFVACIWLLGSFLNWFVGPSYSSNPDASGFLQQYIIAPIAQYVFQLATFVGSNPTAAGLVAIVSLVVGLIALRGNDNTKKKD